MTESGLPVVRGPHGVAVVLFALVWFSCVWFGSWELNPNNVTRLFAALSLAERGETEIDRYQTLTIDKAAFTRRSVRHYYMDKAPGITLMATPPVWAINAMIGTNSYDQVIDVTSPRLSEFLRLRQEVSVAAGAAMLTAFAAVLLLDLGTGITGSPAAGVFAALGYTLGSIVWGWSTSLFGHAPVAALLLIATWAVWRGTSGARELGRLRYPLLAGAALGWAVTIEFPSALSGFAIGLWALWRSRDAGWPVRRRLYLVAAASATVALTPLLLYNQAAFGTPFTLGYQGVVGFGGMNEGLFGLTYPKPAAMWGITFGLRRGLLWVSPVLVLGVGGLVRMLWLRGARDLGLLAVAVIAIVLSVNASYAYWDGGASIGPRHSVPVIPFLALGLAPCWAMLRRAWMKALAAVLLAVSIAINLVIAATDIFAPETIEMPFWTHNLIGLFADGRLNTLPNLYWGWRSWIGFALYLDLALPLLVLLLLWTRRAEHRVDQVRPRAQKSTSS